MLPGVFCGNIWGFWCWEFSENVQNYPNYVPDLDENCRKSQGKFAELFYAGGFIIYDSLLFSFFITITADRVRRSTYNSHATLNFTRNFNFKNFFIRRKVLLLCYFNRQHNRVAAMNLKGRTQHVDKFCLRYFFSRTFIEARKWNHWNKSFLSFGGKMKSFIVVLQGNEGKSFPRSLLYDV